MLLERFIGVLLEIQEGWSFCEPDKGIPVQDNFGWIIEIPLINLKRQLDILQQKNYDMIKMIVNASSNPGDLVMDCFAGSGTTLGAALLN